MQGRLSKQIGNRIQAFPEKYWKSEFSKAKKLGLNTIEWTLDYKNLYKNPIFKKKGKLEIKRLSKKHSVFIKSLTGDCFMQKPFWKLNKNTKLLEDFKKIIEAANDIGIKVIVIPLVDNGSLSKKVEVQNLLRICKYFKKYLQRTKIKIVFESDFNPKKLQKFIKKFDKKYFGINYDVGNSAALNYDIDEEFNLYGERIYNIHIKDRLYKGETVPLGSGHANLSQKIKFFTFNYPKLSNIIQGARSKLVDDISLCKQYFHFVKSFKN